MGDSSASTIREEGCSAGRGEDVNVSVVRLARSLALVGLLAAQTAPTSAQATEETPEPSFAENLQKGVD